MTKNYKSTQSKTIIAYNAKIKHNYFIIDTYEAGIVLVGTEVKSLRQKKVSLIDAFVTIEKGDLWLRNAHIAIYNHGTCNNHTPKRNRKLLMHRKQITMLTSKVHSGNLTILPITLYLSKGMIKVELVLAKGKQSQDKRQDLIKRDALKEVFREIKCRIGNKF